MSIKVTNLLKVYGEQKAVNNISFEVQQGEIVGFLGPNGAGKSTTMKILTGYLQQDGGEAELCGINVKANPIAAKQKVGYLPEANPLYFDLYVREYLDFIANVHGIANKQQRIEEVIATVGLTPESKKKIGQLSKGYKQRVGLAAALLHDPEVLILDEPTSGLDPNQIIEIRNVIKAQGQSKTILFSSHILQEVEAICDRVIIINKGQMVANDTLVNLQQAGNGNNTVELKLSNAIDANIIASEFGAEAQQIGSNQWLFTTKDADALRKKILNLAIAHNWNVETLTTQTNNLEDVFRQLTNG
jgi:ABC-2 type transport system ATP-binding protein